MARRGRGPRLIARKPKNYAATYWFIRYYKAGKRRDHATGCPVSGGIENAETALAGFLIDRQKTGGPRDPAEYLIAEALDAYSAEHAPSTADPDRINHCISSLNRFWGALTIASIRTAKCREYQDQRKAGPGTVRRELACLQAAINYCYREKYLSAATFVWRPKAPAPRDRWMTRKEAAALLRAARKEKKARGHLPLFILIGLYTGQRKEAILSLRWTQNTEGGWIDLDRERIDFNPAERVQTKKRRPVIPIPPRLATFLRLARKRSNSDWVVAYQGERVLSVKRSWATAVKEAKIERVTPHTMRHTCCTWMSQRGVFPDDAAPFVGMSVQTFRNVYWHHHPDFMEAARTALS